jgi:hypothetical protein
MAKLSINNSQAKNYPYWRYGLKEQSKSFQYLHIILALGKNVKGQFQDIFYVLVCINQLHIGT